MEKMATEKEKLKMAIIAGASSAAKYKENNSRATESEVVKHLSQQGQEYLPVSRILGTLGDLSTFKPSIYRTSCGEYDI